MQNLRPMIKDREMKAENLKSCANCKLSDRGQLHVVKPKKEIFKAFYLINVACCNCKNYSSWTFDGLSPEVRFKQEKGNG